MELEEMKKMWQEVSLKLEAQERISEQMILEITQQKVKSKIRQISLPESVGALVCFLMAAYLLFQFQSLDTWYFKLMGGFALIMCTLLPVLALKALDGMSETNMSLSTFAESLSAYASSKKRFVQIQKSSYYLGFIFSLIALPLAAKLMRGINFFETPSMWIWIPVMLAFHFFFSKYLKRKYGKALKEAEALIREIDKDAL